MSSKVEKWTPCRSSRTVIAVDSSDLYRRKPCPRSTDDSPMSKSESCSKDIAKLSSDELMCRTSWVSGSPAFFFFFSSITEMRRRLPSPLSARRWPGCRQRSKSRSRVPCCERKGRLKIPTACAKLQLRACAATAGPVPRPGLCSQSYPHLPGLPDTGRVRRAVAARPTTASGVH